MVGAGGQQPGLPAAVRSSLTPLLLPVAPSNSRVQSGAQAAPAEHKKQQNASVSAADEKLNHR